MVEVDAAKNRVRLSGKTISDENLERKHEHTVSFRGGSGPAGASVPRSRGSPIDRAPGVWGSHWGEAEGGGSSTIEPRNRLDAWHSIPDCATRPLEGTRFSEKERGTRSGGSRPPAAVRAQSGSLRGGSDEGGQGGPCLLTGQACHPRAHASQGSSVPYMTENRSRLPAASFVASPRIQEPKLARAPVMSEKFTTPSLLASPGPVHGR